MMAEPLKVADALLIVSKGAGCPTAQVVEGAAHPKVRVLFEMPCETRDWPGDFMLAILVKIAIDYTEAKAAPGLY